MSEEDGRRLPRVQQRARKVVEAGPDAVDAAAAEIGAVEPDPRQDRAAKVAVGEDGTVQRAALEAAVAELAGIEARLLQVHPVELGVLTVALAQMEPDRLAPADPKAGEPAAGQLHLVQEWQLPLTVGEIAFLQPHPLEVQEPEGLARQRDAAQAPPRDAGASNPSQDTALQPEVGIALRILEPRRRPGYETSSSSIRRSWFARLRPRWRPKNEATRST